MINTALTFLADELNDYLQSLYPTPEPKTILSAHVSLDASPVTDILNKISVTLVNLEPEATMRNISADRLGKEGDFLRINPAVKLNLLVLFAANFTDYSESLKFLTAVLTFFQGRNVFTPQNSPRLAPTLERLVLELVPTTFQEWSFLWGMLGTRYVPGAVYRLRMIVIQDSKVLDSSPAIQTIAVNR